MSSRPSTPLASRGVGTVGVAAIGWARSRTAKPWLPMAQCKPRSRPFGRAGPWLGAREAAGQVGRAGRDARPARGSLAELGSHIEVHLARLLELALRHALPVGATVLRVLLLRRLGRPVLAAVDELEVLVARSDAFGADVTALLGVLGALDARRLHLFGAQVLPGVALGVGGELQRALLVLVGAGVDGLEV